MENWWQHLVLPLQIFYGTGLIAGVMLILEAIFTLSGFHHHNMADAGLDHPDQLGMLSVRTITGFFFGFGWAGVIGIKSGLGFFLSTLLACAVGAIFLLGIYLLMRVLFSMRASGTLDYKNAIGQVATVYLTVPPDRGAGGQIEVLIQGRLQMISCLTAHPSALAPMTKVRVVAQIDQGTLEVEPI